MHRLLERQIKRHLPADIAGSPAWRAFLDAVDAAYAAADEDRRMIERSLELASQELYERNRELELAKTDLARRVEERTAELTQAQQRYQGLVERLPAIVYLAEGSAIGPCRYASPQLSEILGYGLDQWVDAQFRIGRVHPDDRRNLVKEAASSAAARSAFRCEYRVKSADGRWVWVRDEAAPVADTAGELLLMHGVMFDITERKTAEQKLMHDALHDALTGLPNRTLFLDRLACALERIRRNPEAKFAVFFMDLDRFKVVNDSLGHEFGDRLLVAFSQRINECLRGCDSLARLGGDEFTILADHICDAHDADVLARRLHDALRQPFCIGSHEIFTSSSIGIALSSPSYTQPEEMVRDADTAMYHGKSRGSSRHQIFDHAMHERVIKQMQMENDLRRAVDRGEFEVHYQPIIRMDTGRIESLEALIRWRHPERGMVSPAEFIPLAEENGLILRMGAFVLRDACEQVAAWRDALPPELRPSVSVNLSAKQFTQTDLVEIVGAQLRANLLPGEALRLEITESTIMENAETATAMLRRLKDLHVHVDIDDFGTGYSSLGYLHRFPVDKLKIDRFFIRVMHENSDNEAIVRTIVSLAQNLRIQVTAEGVETPDQVSKLLALGVVSGQGFLFSKPLPACDVLPLLMSGIACQPRRAAG